MCTNQCWLIFFAVLDVSNSRVGSLESVDGASVGVVNLSANQRLALQLDRMLGESRSLPPALELQGIAAIAFCSAFSRFASGSGPDPSHLGQNLCSIFDGISSHLMLQGNSHIGS